MFELIPFTPRTPSRKRRQYSMRLRAVNLGPSVGFRATRVSSFTGATFHQSMLISRTTTVTSKSDSPKRACEKNTTHPRVIFFGFELAVGNGGAVTVAFVASNTSVVSWRLTRCLPGALVPGVFVVA